MRINQKFTLKLCSKNAEKNSLDLLKRKLFRRAILVASFLLAALARRGALGLVDFGFGRCRSALRLGRLRRLVCFTCELKNT